MVQTLYTTIIICYSQGEGQGSFIQTFFTGPKLAKNTFSLPLDGPKSGQVLCKNPYLEKSRSEFQTSQSSILFIQSSEKNLSPMKNLSLNYFLVGHPANFPENSGFSDVKCGWFDQIGLNFTFALVVTCNLQVCYSNYRVFVELDHSDHRDSPRWS